MLKIAICDDECYMLDNLKGKINEFFLKSKIDTQLSCFTSGVALLSLLRVSILSSWISKWLD